MNALFRACSAAISSNSTNVLRTSSFCKSSAYRWNASVNHVGAGSVNFNWFLNSFSIRLYSSKGSRRKNSRSQKSGPTLATTPKMNEDGDSFFVVRKGDLIGIYKNLSDCQTQVGSSICDPPVSVFKGYSMPKNTEEYLLSHGLKNALYTVRAQDVTEDLFDTLEPCHPQLSSSSDGMPNDHHMAKKRCQEARWPNYTDDDAGPAAARPTDSSIRKHVMLEKTYDTALSSGSCSLEFDGASKGNPGQAGAGAVLRADDGSLTIKLREGLGVATNNVAEYRAIILGLRCALSKGFTRIRAQGDSKLVCMQIQGLWKVKNENISTLYEQAKQLKDRFHSFQLVHVLRDSNAEADEQANLAIHLADGQVQEEVA